MATSVRNDIQPTNASTIFPSSVGRAFMETENINRDKTRRLRLLVENHHTQLTLSGVQYHCEKGNCTVIPYHTVNIYGSQTAEFSAPVPNSPCSGYVMYRVVGPQPVHNNECETFILVSWNVPIAGNNRLLLEVLQGDASAHLLRCQDVVKVAVRERGMHRMLPASYEQRQGWSVGGIGFVAVAHMDNNVDAALRLTLHTTSRRTQTTFSPPEMIYPPGVPRGSLDGAGSPLRRTFSAYSLKGLASGNSDSRAKSPPRRRSGLTIAISNMSPQVYLQHPRVYNKDGRLASRPASQIAPLRRSRVTWAVGSKLQGCIVYEICTNDSYERPSTDRPPAAYRANSFFLLIGWYIHAKRGNRLCVDVVKARSDLFPGTEQQYADFYSQYVKHMLSPAARPSVWRVDHQTRFVLDAAIDSTTDDPELTLDIRTPQLESERDEAPLFLPSTGFSVTMSGSLAAMAERFSRRTNTDPHCTYLVLENHHHRIAITPVWPSEQSDRRVRQGDFELATLNSSAARWNNEGLRIYRLVPRNVTAMPMTTHYLVVRARGHELSVGVVAAWMSIPRIGGVPLDAVLNYVRYVPGMDCLPASRRIWRTIFAKETADFTLSAFRSITEPPVLSLMVADAQASQIHIMPNGDQAFATPEADTHRHLQGHLNAPLPPYLRVTVLNDQQDFYPRNIQVLSTGCQLAGPPEETRDPMSKSVFLFDPMPANEERCTRIVYNSAGAATRVCISCAVQANGDLLAFYARCRIDEKESDCLDITLAQPVQAAEKDLAGNPRQIISRMVLTSECLCYVAMYFGHTQNGQQTELFVCFADTFAKANACLKVAQERLLASEVNA